VGGEAGGAVTVVLAAAPVVAAPATVATVVGAAAAVGRAVASGEPELEEEMEEAGDGGKNSGNAFFSMRCTVSSLNHDDRTGTVQPCTPLPAAADEETAETDGTVRERARVGDAAREAALTGDAARRVGTFSVSFSSFSFCRASLRRSEDMVGAASVEAAGTDSCLVTAVGLAAVVVDVTEVGEEAVDVWLEVGDTTAEARESGLCSM